MMANKLISSQTAITRREFVRDCPLTAVGIAAFIKSANAQTISSKPLNFNENMEYRRLGKTGLMVSAVCLGGHWKRIGSVIGGVSESEGWNAAVLSHPEFIQNRKDIVSACIESGINYVDACRGDEVLAYSAALKGRRDKMFFGYSWAEKESRFKEYRSASTLMQGLDEGLKAASLDYVDLWRITCFEQGGEHTYNESEEVVAALDTAKRQGKARFTGISSHDRRWLKWMVREYPTQIEVILTPYTANTKVLPEESLFDEVRKHDVGVFGIKPFASNSLFKGNSAPNNPYVEEDDERARLAVRYILGNPSITAPIPGLVSRQQVENMVRAVKDRRQLEGKEATTLRNAAAEAWARLPEEYQWLKDWEYV
jgi:aryl-alcohol dehydrogenase-like predicted oxidoreductase